MFQSLCRWLVIAVVSLYALASGAETVKVAFIGSLSGTFALQGQETLDTLLAAVDMANAASVARKLEIVPLDNKGSPQETVVLLKQIIDQDIRIVISGVSNNSSVIVDALSKHNARNPDKPVVFLDYGALDPALTESKCNFWHFRFEPHADTQIGVLTDELAKQRNVRKVYLINQDYAFGQAASRGFREAIAAKRPDVEIVGDDLVPLGKVKDFAPYAAKIRASGADAVATGNWGNDLSLLIKSGRESGLSVTYYALLAAYFGTAREIGADGADKVKTLYSWTINVAEPALAKRLLDQKAKLKSLSNLDYLPVLRLVSMLSAALDKGGGADAMKVASALEGMRYAGPSGDSWMRAEDHQIVAPIYVLGFAKAGQPGVPHDTEGTGYGWKVERVVEARDAVPAMKCRMERPAR